LAKNNNTPHGLHLIKNKFLDFDTDKSTIKAKFQIYPNFFVINFVCRFREKIIMKKSGFLTFAAALLISFIAVYFYIRPNAAEKNVVGDETYRTEIREFQDFTKVDASGALNIVIVAGKDFKVELESEQKALDEIETKLEDDTLQIYSKKDWSSSKTQVAVRISMPKLEGVKISGNSKGVVSNVKSNDFSLTLNGASSIKISGETDNLDATANGASKIEAENLKTENTIIEMNGASTAKIYASNSLDANAYGASSISYIGKPKNVKKETSGASSVSEK
jgi:predicted DNA binding CopG/RHH family protein